MRSLDKVGLAAVVTKDSGTEGIFMEPISLEFIIVAYWVWLGDDAVSMIPTIDSPPIFPLLKAPGYLGIGTPTNP